MAKKALTPSATQVERTLDADELLDRLHLHAATVDKNGSNIFIEIDRTFIRFTTNTLVALRQSTLPLEGSGVASALIDFNKFTDIITNMSGEIILGIDQEKRMIFVNRDEVFISGLDPDDATVIPKRTITPTIRIADGEAFSQAIARCAYAATTEKEKRPNLEGLSFSCDGTTPVMEIIGANGIVFCFDTTTQITSAYHEFKFFVHYSALSTLRLLPKEPIWIAIDDEHGRCWLVSENEQWEMMLRLADYKFPMERLKSSTPTDGTNIATVNAKVFKKAYALPRIAGQLSTTTTNGKNSFDALLTEILFADGEMTIQTYNGGESHGAKKTIPCEGVGSGRMIIDQLMDKNVDFLLGKERITFTFRDPASPYIVTTDSLPGYVTMIMQIQPNDKGKK